MTAEDLVYDILEIKNALNNDSDIDEFWLLNKINMYRAVFIVEDYRVNQEIKPSWIQRLRKQKVSKVTPADDPSITVSSIALGKVTLPKVISFPDNMGLVRVSGSSGITSFDQIDFDTLMLKLHFNEERMGEFGYCAMVGNDLFLSPLTREIQALVIPEDPFAVQVMDTDGTLRDMTETDEYPIDLENAQKIVIEILTKDLAINMQSISDITNDAQSQLKILQNGNSRKQTTD